MKKTIFLFLFFSHILSAKQRVDVVCYPVHLPYFDDAFQNPTRLTKLKNQFSVRFKRGLHDYIRNFQKDDGDLRKIIFLESCRNEFFSNLPKHKTICFKIEPRNLGAAYYEHFYKVYTFQDDVIDNKKFFKFYYPVLRPMLAESKIPSFGQKQLSCIIAKHWTQERVKICDFFASKPQNALHIYGKMHNLPKYEHHPMSKGAIQGWPTSSAKIETLKRYKFSFCFENCAHIRGYITEKIFDVMAAGCVPIYWGPENVEEYIPKECFIDYKKFNSDETLYQFLITMKEEQYNKYLTSIRAFLTSDKAQLFSPENFDRIVEDAIRN